MKKGRQKSWWRDRFITLMVIPERTRRVHKLVVPFFLLKFGAILACIATIFFVVIGIDYIHVLGRIAENKRLKGENFKLRQEMQLIRNKVDSMEMTIERVRNYARKLQIITGQGDKGETAGGVLEGDGDVDRTPSSKPNRRSSLSLPIEPDNDDVIERSLNVNVNTFGAPALDTRVDRLELISGQTEGYLSKLQVSLIARTAITMATPSLLPIHGWLSSPFGYRRNPYDGTFKLHAGVDIAAEPGTPVRATAPGVVVFSGLREGYGKVVVVSHGYGINTLFAHCSKLFVNSGARVKRGETIAEVGATGHATGPHVHYEIRKNGVPVNPTLFFTRTVF